MLNLIFQPLLAESSRGLHGLDYGVVLVYLLATFAAGVYFSRGQSKGEDYFVGGRRMPWFAVGLSLVASLMSTVSYLASPGEVLQHGLALSIGWLALPLAFLVVNFLWIPFFMRLGITSIYEYLEQRFGLVARWLGAGLFVFILRLFWMSTIVLTASRAVAQITYDSLEHVLPWELTLNQWTLAVLLSVGVFATFYTMLGGIKAVIWTDVAQFIVLFAGLIVTLVVVVVDTNSGPIDWWHKVTSTGEGGHDFPPLASWDITVRSTILFTVLNAFFWYCCTFIGDQVAVQRYLSTSSVSAAVRGNIVNFVANFMVMILLAVCGMALLTYYLDPQFQTEIVNGITDPRDARVADKVFPYFIAHGLPVGMSGLVVAALFAVAMSSLDSGVNSVAAVLTIDVFRRVNPQLSSEEELRLARMLSLIIGLGCTGLAWSMLYIPEHYNIIGITARTFNCALGPLGAMFFVGMFFSRVGQRAIIASTFLGLIVAIGAAWWVELIWAIGLTKFATFQEASQHMRGPSPFLVTPLAATSSILLAVILGWLMPCRDPKKAKKYCWGTIVRGDRKVEKLNDSPNRRSN
jgi:solute:Na+ symporter, SSS family